MSENFGDLLDLAPDKAKEEPWSSLPDGGIIWVGRAKPEELPELYALTLSWWDELLLTRVRRTVPGDAYFPRFEHLMDRAGVIRETSDFTIERYQPAPWRLASSQGDGLPRE